jgi:hypothetical protein
MNQLRSEVATLEVGQKRLKRLASIAACGGAVALALTASKVHAGSLSQSSYESPSAPGLELVGYNTNKIWVTDEQTAGQEAESIAASGANAVRIQEPYTQGGAEVNNDLLRLCTAARVAYKNHLQLIITMVGHYRNGELGFMPTAAAEQQRYVTAVDNMMWDLAGDDHGCVPEQKNLIIGAFNEPDNPLYNSNQYVNGKWVAPQNEVNLLSYAYPRVKAEAAKNGLNADVTFVGGDLASPSVNRNNMAFIKRMAEIIRAKNLSNPIMDMFALHWYANTSSTSPSAPNNYFGPGAVVAVKTYINPNMPVIYDELGAFSATPKTKERQYKVRLPASIKPFPAYAQGDFYRNFINDATCAGADGILIYHQDDDPGDVLRTGVGFPDGSPKESKAPVKDAFLENSVGSNIVCN